MHSPHQFCRLAGQTDDGNDSGHVMTNEDGHASHKATTSSEGECTSDRGNEATDTTNTLTYMTNAILACTQLPIRERGMRKTVLRI